MNIKINQTLNCDVAVIGGGTAGSFAAISAAAAGARVILIEKNGVLGGAITAEGVNCPGLFHAWGRQIVSGHCWQLLNTAAALGKAEIPEVRYNNEKFREQQIRVNALTFAQLLDRMCEFYSIDVYFHSMLAAAQETEKGAELLICCKEGLKKIEAKRVIDATGDASVVSGMGFDVKKSDTLQPGTLYVKIGGYDPACLDAEMIKNAVNGAPAGSLPADFTGERALSCLNSGELNFHTSCDANAETSQGKSKMEMAARANATRVITFLNALSGLENLKAEYFAISCAVRETVRIDGVYEITEQDYIEGIRFEDGVCHAFYPVDIHTETGIENKLLEPERVPTVPYRALLPKGAKHTLAAGRIVSSDRVANSGLRTQAPCMAMGQAAGVAAAISSEMECDVGDVPVDAIRDELKRQGATIPMR